MNQPKIKMFLCVASISSLLASTGFARSTIPASLPLSAISSSALDSNAPPVMANDWRKAVPVVRKHAMVVSAQHLATEVGVEILKRGGNAIDAAVAVGYALAVVHPCCGNIGGGGFMTIHLANGQNLFLNFRERAPLKATAKLFQDASGNVTPGLSTQTYLAVGTPGTVMGLNTALKRLGTLPLRTVIAPAIALARQGYVLQAGDVRILGTRANDFASEPNVAAIFLDHGHPFQVGATLKQPELAQSLETIARGGTQAFYHGDIAQAIVAASAAKGGVLTMKDFANYTVKWETPILCKYRGFTLVTAPPPSSGGTTLCEILQVLNAYPLHQWGYGAPQSIHYFVEAERHAFADRNSALGDPDFINNPVARLISPTHAAEIRAAIKPDQATPSSEVHGDIGASEGHDTTHFSVVDAHGNAVSVTYTINYLFGNAKIAGSTGFFLNDEMDDFTAKPGVPNGFGLVQGAANAIAPGKRPLSSMTPTILLKGGKLFMVTGSPGGSTIISTVAQSIIDTVDYDMSIQQAVNAPRIHHQWLPDQVMVEQGALSDASTSALTTMGYHLVPAAPWGADEAIRIDPVTKMLEGANDRRRPAGLADGY